MGALWDRSITPRPWCCGPGCMLLQGCAEDAPWPQHGTWASGAWQGQSQLGHVCCGTHGLSRLQHPGSVQAQQAAAQEVLLHPERPPGRVGAGHLRAVPEGAGTLTWRKREGVTAGQAGRGVPAHPASAASATTVQHKSDTVTYCQAQEAVWGTIFSCLSSLGA